MLFTHCTRCVASNAQLLESVIICIEAKEVHDTHRGDISGAKVHRDWALHAGYHAKDSLQAT